MTNHTGQRVIIDGQVIQVPLAIEVDGPEAVQQFIASQCAPLESPAEEPTAPATTPAHEE